MWNRANGVDYYAKSCALPCGCGRGMRRVTLFKWGRIGACPCGASNPSDTVLMRPKRNVVQNDSEWEKRSA